MARCAALALLREADSLPPSRPLLAALALVRQMFPHGGEREIEEASRKQLPSSMTGAGGGGRGDGDAGGDDDDDDEDK